MFKIIDAVRDRCPQSSGFCIGVKLNSSDYVVRSKHSPDLFLVAEIDISCRKED